MTLALSDWLIIALYFVVSAAIGLAYTRKAGQSPDAFARSWTLPVKYAGYTIDPARLLPNVQVIYNESR